jgi:membrane fusion protein (multidrug efflux system)
MRHSFVMLGLVSIIACGEPAAIELPPPKVGVATVLHAEIGEEGQFPGRTVAPQRVEIRTQIEGTIRERSFTDGQKVNRGEPLFQIDARSPEAALAQAKADLARAQVQAADAAKIAATNQRLYEQQVVGSEEYQQSQADAEAAEALVRAQQAIVRSAKLTRGFATIVAPFDGRIGEAEVDVGSFVAPGGARLAVLARVDPMYVDFALSEREFLRLPGTEQLREQVRSGVAIAASPRAGASGMQAINDRVLVALQLADGSIHPYQGMLSIVSIELDEETGTYPMRAVFPNPEELLIPGLFGHVIIRQRAKHEALLLPQEALTLQQVGVVVNVVGEDDTIEQRRVELGQRIGEMVEIEEGLAEGEVVVIRGVHKCRDALVVDPQLLDPLTLASDPLAVEPAAGPEGWFQRFLAERRTATLVGD